MSIRELAVGAAITIFIGGSAYTISQTDVLDNFVDDTGVSQEEAQDFFDAIEDEGLMSFDEIGKELVEEGNEAIAAAREIDCVNYKYDWESSTLSCEQGRSQLHEIGENELSLGNAYILMEESESEAEIKRRINDVISKIDEVNRTYDYEIMQTFYNEVELREAKNRNSYNKALLQTVLDEI